MQKRALNSSIGLWLFFAGLALMSILGTWYFIELGVYQSNPTVAYPSALFDFLALLGVAAFNLRKPIISSAFWKVFTILYALKQLLSSAMVAKYLVFSPWHWFSPITQQTIYYLISYTLIYIAVFLIFKYAFLSSSIWHGLTKEREAKNIL
ncbi:MAG: hypothetical protein Q7T48_21640 [Cellvibrio sp.]|uniref:hypothetical protein n=1 Tax=Cellvibrio sp. TaxID=1965322 RepID=UPI0027270933|nr:hypothetical protein [Cellvibrio sp.]